MIRTPVCDLLGIDHPIALGGMGSASSPAMTAAGAADIVTRIAQEADEILTRRLPRLVA